MSRYGELPDGPLEWPAKDPDEVLDYAIDWKARLAGDAIASSAWTVPTGLTENSSSVSGTKTVLWLSGGTLDQSYSILNRITTTGGRTMDQSVTLSVRSK
jgi:hypothetical protein